MSTAIVRQRTLTPDVWQMIQAVAPVMTSARLFGVATSEQAAGIMIKGYELGFSLSASFENIVVIEGKPALVPKGALALIFNSPLRDTVTITDETDANGKPLACTVYMKRKDGFEYTARFSMEDAKRAGLIKPLSGWEKYPSNMLRWRAVGFCADIVFPDVLGGLKRADELGADLTPAGEVIEGSWTHASAMTNSSLQLQQETYPDVIFYPRDVNTYLGELVSAYGAEAVMAANGGTIPTTQPELLATEDTLKSAKADS